MRATLTIAGGIDSPAKPRGGYRLINVGVVAAAWWAYRHKLIRIVDLRVWFAAHEMDARRCRIEHVLSRRFAFQELRNLTGSAPRRLRDSIRRLQAARLLRWSDTAINFPDSPDDLLLDRADELGAFLDRIPNRQRKAPVPRRTLRHLAGGARPALIATVLGHLIRGLYLKRGLCSPRGRVKASWIADTFGVGLRRVKQARQELIAIGWLIPLEADQWALNRWGAHFRINLDWSRLDTIEPFPLPAATHPNHGEISPGLALPPATDGPGLAPPDSHKEPLNGSEKNQEPASGLAGISISKLLKNALESPDALGGTVPSVPPALASLPALTTVAPATSSPVPQGSSSSSRTRPVTKGKPNFRDVVPEDLKDTGRLLVLFNEAVARGWVRTSERDRLRFVSAAEHAWAIGTKNPCGLFVRLVRCGLWSFLTQDDEDLARVRLRRHLYGMTPVPQSPPSLSVREAVFLSHDARLVREIRAAVARTRYGGDAFPLLRREHPDWTRERWDVALTELEQAVRVEQR